MTTALFSPKSYTGEFATLNWQDNGRGWTVTLWQFGKPVRYTPHGKCLSPALMEILSANWVWCNQAMQAMFEQDVILAGGM